METEHGDDSAVEELREFGADCRVSTAQEQQRTSYEAQVEQSTRRRFIPAAVQEKHGRIRFIDKLGNPYIIEN